jgi:hypothetical protein
LDYLGYADSRTSASGCEIPFGAKGASLPTLLLRAGRSYDDNASFATLESNGTGGQLSVGAVRELCLINAVTGQVVFGCSSGVNWEALVPRARRWAYNPSQIASCDEEISRGITH